MLKSSSNSTHELRLSRSDVHNRAQSPATMDALRTSFLPNLSMESTIVTTAHFCPMCGQQFEGPQQATEHMHLCHGGLSVVTGVSVGGNGGLLLAPTQHQQHVTSESNGGPANAMKIDYPCLNCDEKFDSQHELDNHHRLIHQGPTSLLARCPACNFYGISAHTLQDTNEYKCVHCGSLCTASNLSEPDNQHQALPPPPQQPPPSSAHSTYSQQNTDSSMGTIKVSTATNDNIVLTHRQTYQQQQQQQPQPHHPLQASNTDEDAGSLKVSIAEEVNFSFESEVVMI